VCDCKCVCVGVCVVGVVYIDVIMRILHLKVIIKVRRKELNYY